MSDSIVYPKGYTGNEVPGGFTGNAAKKISRLMELGVFLPGQLYDPIQLHQAGCRATEGPVGLGTGVCNCDPEIWLQGYRIDGLIGKANAGERAQALARDGEATVLKALKSEQS